VTVLLIAGSPSAPSRSAVLLDAVAARLALRDVAVERIAIRELAAHALLLGEASHPAIQHAAEQVRKADAIVIATPVYKAAYSGVLKVFLDLLPQSALKGKTVLPLATGGSPHHMLALDYALRPVLQSLGAKSILPGIYATDAQVTLTPEGSYHLNDDIAARLDDAVNVLVTETLRPSPAQATRFAPVHFSQVRCSV
jgi:FMN reductase